MLLPRPHHHAQAKLLNLLNWANAMVPPERKPLLQLPQRQRIRVAVGCLQAIALLYRTPTREHAAAAALEHASSPACCQEASHWVVWGGLLLSSLCCAA